MSVLDTFYLLFKSNAKEARADTAALDKQLDELEKKGKKRSADENKRYQELKKHRKEQLDQTKQQEREQEKLSQSFQTMIASAVGAVGAYASFGALKSGLADANKLNASLVVLRDTYGLNVQELKAYAAAIDLAGGNGQEFIGFVTQQARLSREKFLPIIQPGEWIRRLREGYRQPFGPTNLQSIGVPDSVFELLNKSPEEFEKLRKEGFDKAKFDKEQQEAAKELQGSIQGTKDSFDSLNTAINATISGPLKAFNAQLQSAAQWLQQHPGLGLAAEGGAVVASGAGGYLGLKLLRRMWNGITGVFGRGAASVAAAEAAAAPVEAAESSTGIGIPLAIATAAAAAAYALWRNYRSNNSAAPEMPSAFPPGLGGNKQKIYSFWLSRGYNPGAAAGWTANAQAESSFNPFASNGNHVGLYQWSPERRARILKGTGIDVSSASLDQQLQAAYWEAGTMNLGPSAFGGNAAQSAALISNKYEVPALDSAGLAAAAAHRAQIASSYGNVSMPDGGSISVKTGDIHIETQATDAAGIASGVASELRNQIRIAMSNFDDGVNY